MVKTYKNSKFKEMEDESNMEMGAKESIESIKPEGEIYTCPTCGYTDGFHVSFDIKQGADTGDVVLICPACHARFRMGWSVQMG